MGALATDNFNRSNGGLGGNWSTITGAGAPQIDTNAVRTNAVGTDSVARYSATTFPNNQYSQVKVTALDASATGSGAIVRAASGTNDYYLVYAEVLFGSTAQLTLRKFVGGSSTLIASSTETFALNDTLYLEVSGTTLKVKVNGTTISALTSTDSAHSSGWAGVVVFVDSGSTADAKLDDWEGGDFGFWLDEDQLLYASVTGW